MLRRYMSISLHTKDYFQSLGIIRILGSMSAKSALRLLKTRLEEFGLDLQKNVVGMMSDGAIMMMKMGRDSRILHVTCLAHAIHLCVCDIIYKPLEARKKSLEPEVLEEDYDLDSDDGDDNDDNINNNEEMTKVAPEFDKIVAKVKKILKISRNSPVRNDDILQPEILVFRK